MLASLPMYDFAEHREATDALWSAVAAGLRRRGIPAPAQLTRSDDPFADWQSPDLLMSQACGLPFVRHLRGRVTVLGTADHGLKDCSPGTYRSRVIVRRDDPAERLADLEGRRLAINSSDSQSGAGALRTAVRALRRDKPFFSRILETGAHVESIRDVARGRADVAAIDSATFAMAQRYVPETRDVRVLLSTPETPGLPFITAREGPAGLILSALDEAIAGLSPDLRSTLLLHGVVRRTEADYDAIAAADRAAVPLAPEHV